MDETAKTRGRNVISAIAYILLAILGGVFTISTVLDGAFIPVTMIALEVLVGIAGIALLILKKRDLTAIVFLMFATLFAYYTATGGVRFSTVTAVLCWLFILFPIILLTTKEKKASSYFCVLLPYGIGAIAFAYLGGASIVTIILHIIFSLIALFTGILYLAEKAKLPLALKLRSDENVEFTRAGPCLAFYLLAVFAIVAAVSAIMQTGTAVTFTSLSLACGISLAAIAVILAVFARMRIGALLVFIAGVVIALAPVAGTLFPDKGTLFFIIAGIVFIILAICALFRKRVFSATAMFILIGVTYLLAGCGIQAPVLYTVLWGIAGLIGVYLTLALLKKKPLPLI